jgi:cobalt-zinc-cadmium efflux system outer membrane protein
MIRRYFRTALLLALLITAGQGAYAQTDTLKITFKDAEKAFLDKNLNLLAQKYNVDAAQALLNKPNFGITPF